MSFISRLMGGREESQVPDWKLAHPTWRFDHVAAGKKSAATCRIRYGLNYFQRIGRSGGRISRGGGFAKNPELARAAGAKGGMAPHRPKNMDAYFAPRFTEGDE